MQLIDAFRILGPLTGNHREDELRREAAECLFEKLTALSKRLQTDTTERRKDLVADALLNLCRFGPRGIKQGDPDNNEGVARYLIVILNHLFISQIRASRRRPKELVDIAGLQLLGDGVAFDDRHKCDIDVAHDYICKNVIPEIEATYKSKNDAAGFRETIQVMHEIQTGRTTSEQAAAKLHIDNQKTFSKRIERAKNRIIEWLIHEGPSHPPARVKAMILVFQDLYGFDPGFIIDSILKKQGWKFPIESDPFNADEVHRYICEAIFPEIKSNPDSQNHDLFDFDKAVTVLRGIETGALTIPQGMKNLYGSNTPDEEEFWEFIFRTKKRILSWVPRLRSRNQIQPWPPIWQILAVLSDYYGIGVCFLDDSLMTDYR